MKFKHFTVLILVFLVLVSCSKKSEKKGIDLEVKMSPETVTDFLYAKMNYQFKLSDDFKGLDDNYRFFVHFWRKKTKEMLLQDDHIPVDKPFSKWKAGDSFSYSRVVFIPQFIDEFDADFEGYEEVRITVGLHKPSDNKSAVVLFQKVINIQAASVYAPPKSYDEGWYQPETDMSIKNKEEQTWRWVSKKSVCIINNPKKESLLIIRGGVDKKIIPDQKIIFKINNTVLEEFVPETAKFSKRYIIKPEMMGGEDEFKLVIETDKSFVPAQITDKGVIKDSKDYRELGVQIFFFYFRENVQ